LSEILVGITPAQTTDRTSLEKSADPSEPAWLYSIETASAAEPGLLSVRVTVMRDQPAEKHPVQFSLARWIVDPNTTPSATAQGAQQGGTPGPTSTSGGAP
jgi:hypothetical protein